MSFMTSLNVPADGDPKKGDPGDRSFGGHLNELVTMIVTYAKQETIDPIKGLVRFVAWGVAGALLIAIGGAALTLAVVRLLQTETGPHLRGDLTWVPYMGGALVAVVGIVWSVSRIFKGDR